MTKLLLILMVVGNVGEVWSEEFSFLGVLGLEKWDIKVFTKKYPDGELKEESHASNVSTPTASKPQAYMTKKEKKIQRAKQLGFFKQNVKPDLRKRTWDKVDTGLGSLDYDEDEGAAKRAPTKPAQRRRISYDD